MTFEGSAEIRASQQMVWDFIRDPNQIAKCIKGLSEIQIQDEKHFSADLDLGLSFVTGAFHIDVAFFNEEPIDTISAKVDAKGMGCSAIAISSLHLTETEGVTQIAWTMDVERHGLLAPVPESLILGVSKGIQDDVIAKLKQHLEA